MQIKFDSDDNSPLNKTVEISIMTIVVGAVFHKNNKYYPHVFLDECLFKTWKCFIVIKLAFLEELILIKQIHQKSAMFVTIGIS